MVEPKTWLVSKEQEGNLEAVAEHIKQVVKLKAKREIEAGVGGLTETPWFVERHLNVVEQRTDWILDNCEEAEEVDRNEAKIAVWTHDLGRVMGWSDYHHVASAQKTRQWLIDNGVNKDVAERVYSADLRHRASGDLQPESKLEKVIASADALSHFDGAEKGTVEGFMETKGFWYILWEEKIKDGAKNEEILERSFEKMERDATSKQGFDKSRTRAEKEYEFMKANANTILQTIRQEVESK